MEIRIESKGILNISWDTFLKKANDLMLKGKTRDKIITEKMLMNNETLQLTMFCAGYFYTRFKKLLS